MFEVVCYWVETFEDTKWACYDDMQKIYRNKRPPPYMKTHFQIFILSSKEPCWFADYEKVWPFFENNILP